MTTLETLRSNRDEILQLVESYGATNLRVFGSVLKGNDNQDSDIDFLVDWESEHSLFDRIDLAHQLEDKLNKKIDLIVAKNLHWYVKDDIMNYAEPL